MKSYTNIDTFQTNFQFLPILTHIDQLLKNYGGCWTVLLMSTHKCLFKWMCPKILLFLHTWFILSVNVFRYLFNHIYRSHSQILVTWQFCTNHEFVPWNGEKLHIRAEFQQFNRNNMSIRVPGKLSKIHSKVWFVSNPENKVLKGVKTRGQICPVL